MRLAVLFVGVVTATVCMIPVALISAAAGYIAGVSGGAFVAITGLSFGAALSSQIAKRAGADYGAAAFGTRAENWADWIGRRPARSILVARLLPGVPFHLVSYAAGLTGARPVTVAAASFVGFGPRCFVFTALGGSIGSPSTPETRAALVASLLLLAAAALLPRWGPFARRFMPDAPS